MRTNVEKVLVRIGRRDKEVTFTARSRNRYTVECLGYAPIEIEKTKEGYVGTIYTSSKYPVTTNPKKHPGLVFEVLARDFWSRH